MTRDDIIKLAREAGFMPTVLNHWPSELERFAATVAAAEREACSEHYLDIMRKAVEEERSACASICEGYDRKFDIPEVRWCAQDIRARSNLD